MEIPQVIDSFSGPFEFLSNFYRRAFRWRGQQVATSEHAFQSEKALHESDRKMILDASGAGAAKRLGRQVAMRDDWDKRRESRHPVKRLAMRMVLEHKFADPEMQDALVETGNAVLVEGNTWCDNYWGDCKCSKCRNIKGMNVLGIELMRLRSKIKKRLAGPLDERSHDKQ